LRTGASFTIEDIHQTIGENAAILEHEEQLNTDAMYAINEVSVKVMA
jgi:hypothetical protein